MVESADEVLEQTELQTEAELVDEVIEQAELQADWSALEGEEFDIDAEAELELDL